MKRIKGLFKTGVQRISLSIMGLGALALILLIIAAFLKGVYLILVA